MRQRTIAASILIALSGFAAAATGDVGKHSESGVHLVELEGDALAVWRGGVVSGKHYAATSPAATGRRKLDVSRPESKAYLGHLETQHAAFLAAASAALGRPVRARFDYTVVANGMAIELDGNEAAALRKLPGVVAIAPERIDRVMTDAGPAWIGAEPVWNGTVPGSNVRTRGETVVVGVIDTGINASHPSFADVGADGYNHTNPRGRFFGACETAPARCNDKLIGIRDYTQEGGRDGSDTDGHGSHVASTAAGNVVDSFITTMTGNLPVRVSGVAPHANVVSYKACILGEGDDPGACPGSATLAALNQAVIDQVDVINYSIGGDPGDPWSGVRGSLDQEGAFLNARFAGVVGVVAAGNDGPGAGTVSSPSNAPWVLAVANVSHDRKFANAAANVTGAGISTPLEFQGQSLTSESVTATVVDAAARGFPLCSQGDAIDFPPSGASNPFAPGTFNGEIVLCRRGITGRVTKGFNVRAGGARGMILYNSPAEGESTVPDDHYLPATHIGNAAGQQLVAALAAARAQGGSVQATITAARSTRTGTGDLLAASSGRGPVETVGGYLKPDIAAPGSGILAAARTGNGLATLSGTSMASPHVAGAAALLAAANPDWGVAQIVSALQTTAIDDVVLPDGTTRASFHDGGAGRAHVATAARAGLWLDVTREQFVAADPSSNATGPGARNPSALNLPSLVSEDCVDACTFTRTLTAFGDAAWRASVSAPAGVRVSVSPDNFGMTRGQSTVLTINVAIEDPRLIGRWSFGTVELTPTGTAPAFATQRLPFAVLPDPGELPALIRIDADTTNGFRDIQVPNLASLKNPRFDTGPLARLNGESRGLPADATRDDPYDLPSAGVFTKFFDPPANLADGGYGVYVETGSATSRDVDLYLGLDDNNDGQVQESEERCVSGGPNANERCAIAFPNERTKKVWILVQNYAASSAGATDIISLRDAIVPLKSPAAAPKLAATAPGLTSGTVPVRVSWNEPRMLQGETWIGFAGLGFGAGAVEHAPVLIARANNLAAPIVMQTGAAGRDSEAIALAPGNAHDRIVIDVPATATAMTVTTAGSGEVDLYVARAPGPITGPELGTAPPRGMAQGTSIHPGATERVDLTGSTLTPGRWYLTPVNAGTSDASFTLEVALTESGSAPVITDNGYYNPARAGHGVFFHQIGELWAVVWYTYLQDGGPIWYIATGPRPAAGRGTWSAPLLRFTWDGNASASTIVGEATITPTARDRFVYTWVVDGIWASEVFEPTGTIACAPVTGSNTSIAGSWFAPAKPGYGFNIVTTPATEAMTAYVYDASGNPRWLLGSTSTPGRGAVAMTQFAGFCPTCAFSAIRPNTGGTLTRAYTSETTGSAALALSFTAPANGAWASDHAIQKITATIPCNP